MRDLAFDHQPPGRHAGSPDGRTEVGAVEPVERAVFQVRQFAFFHQLANPDPMGMRHFFVGDDYTNHSVVERGLALG